MNVKVIKDVVVLETMPTLVQHDILTLSFVFKHDDDTIFDLTGYDEARFKARLTNETITKINNVMSITAGTSGIATLDFESADLASSGVYFTEVSVSSSSEIRSVSVGRLFIQEEL